MKKILFLNSLYNPNIGGVENSIKELSAIYIKMGYEVSLICSDRNYVDNQILEDNEIVDGINVFRYKYPYGFFGFFVQFYNILKLILIKKDTYDLIISRGYVLTFLAALVYGLKVVYIVPAVIYYQNEKSKKKILDCIIQYLSFLFSKKNYVFTEKVANQVDKQLFGMKKSEIINVGINVSRFYDKRNMKNSLLEELKIPKDKKVVLCLGRFSEVKNFNMALQAISFLDESFILLLVGEGPELDAYKKYVEKNNLHKRVLIYGATNKPENFYAISDIFLMLSRYEAFGQVLLEATAARNKIVALDCIESKTSVKDIFGNSSFVKYCKKYDPYELSLCISYIYEKQVNVRDYEKVLSNYSWDNMAIRLLHNHKDY